MSAKSDLVALCISAEEAILAVKVAAENLPENDGQIEELQKKIQELDAEVASLKEVVSAKDALLAQANELAKTIDAAIPDD